MAPPERSGAKVETSNRNVHSGHRMAQVERPPGTELLSLQIPLSEKLIKAAKTAKAVRMARKEVRRVPADGAKRRGWNMAR